MTVSDGFPRTIHRDRQSGATTQLCRISIDRGLGWEGAQAGGGYIICKFGVYKSELALGCT